MADVTEVVNDTLYSYAKNGTYRHAATSLMVASNRTASEPVAATRR